MFSKSQKSNEAQKFMVLDEELSQLDQTIASAKTRRAEVMKEKRKLTSTLVTSGQALFTNFACKHIKTGDRFDPTDVFKRAILMAKTDFEKVALKAAFDDFEQDKAQSIKSEPKPNTLANTPNTGEKNDG